MKNIWVAYYFPIVCGVFFSCWNPSQAQLSLPPPTVETGDAIHITSSTATLTGTSSYQRVPGAWFNYGTTSGSYNGSVRATPTFVTSKELWSADVSGLSPATAYYYRIAAYDSWPGGRSDTGYGDEKSFLTLAGTPTVTPTPTPNLTPISTPAPCDEGIILETYQATEVTSDSATLNGLIAGAFSFRGNLGFVYGTSRGPYTNRIGIEGIAVGRKSVRVDGLLAGTTYYHRIYKYRYEIIPDFTPCYSYGNEEVFTTLTGAVCEAASVSVSPKRLVLQRGQSSEVTVILQGNNCIPEGKTVTATIGRAGGRRISISSASEVADANGQARFTITAKYKIGNAKVTFDADSLKKALTVWVRQ